MSDTSDHDKTHIGDDPDQNYTEYETEDGEVSQQIGLNGKPITSSPSGSNIYMSSRPKIRLDMSIPIDHQLIKRFVSQIRNEDFSIEIEKLIDLISWKQILRICKGRNRDINSISQTLRLEQILQLETYLFKKENEAST
jgi:hypothetical protein